jgi:hypothetical protein
MLIESVKTRSFVYETRSLVTTLPAVSVAIRPRLAANISVRKLAGACGLALNGPAGASFSRADSLALRQADLPTNTIVPWRGPHPMLPVRLTLAPNHLRGNRR